MWLCRQISLYTNETFTLKADNTKIKIKSENNIYDAEHRSSRPKKKEAKLTRHTVYRWLISGPVVYTKVISEVKLMSATLQPGTTSILKPP